MDPGALGKELLADNPLETAISRKRAPTNELTMLAGQPMETKNSKKQALAKELRTLADELLKESGPTHGDEELQETSTGQRVEDVGGRTPQRKLEEQQGPHCAYPRNSNGHLCEAQG